MLYFLEDTFGYAAYPDYPNAMNGLQVEGKTDIVRIGAAVDASERTIKEAVLRGVDLLLVHHGLFWDGLGPLTGPRFRKIAALVRGEIALFSLHLPLDAHQELGNNVLLLKELGLEPMEPFGSFMGASVGWWASAGAARDELVGRLERAVGGSVRLIPGGPEKVGRVGVLTGAGSSALHEAVEAGVDTVVTGEAPHHAYHDAMELEVNLVLGGHYATEVFGVRALAKRLAEEFDLEWEFLHFPTGL